MLQQLYYPCQVARSPDTKGCLPEILAFSVIFAALFVWAITRDSNLTADCGFAGYFAGTIGTIVFVARHGLSFLDD